MAGDKILLYYKCTPALQRTNFLIHLVLKNRSPLYLMRAFRNVAEEESFRIRRALAKLGRKDLPRVGSCHPQFRSTPFRVCTRNIFAQNSLLLHFRKLAENFASERRLIKKFEDLYLLMNFLSYRIISRKGRGRD